MNKSQTIVIAGGSGLVGRKLSLLLKEEGHAVRVLTRNPEHFALKNIIPAYSWNVERKEIDHAVFAGADVLINLCGTGIADSRWTDDRKMEIKNSRVMPVKFLLPYLQKTNHTLKHYIGASATGYYGAVSTDYVFSEFDPPAHDFLGKTCIAWETAHNRMQKLVDKVTIIRIPPVLSSEGGMLPKVAKSIKIGAGAVIGSGKQYLPWVHINDLCRVFIHVVDHTREGVYNAVAPDHITNKEFTKALARVLHRPLLLPKVPEMVLRLSLGEMADLMLKGSRVSSRKIESENFHFKFDSINKALGNIYANK